MRILAIESATELAGVAVAQGSSVLASATLERGRRHGENLAPAIDAVCRRAGTPLGDIDAVVVDVGPGLFTGLRVGVATAKAIAFALDLPVATATSLEVLALGAARCIARGGAGHGMQRIVAVVDARRGEVFSARFEFVAGGVGSQGVADAAGIEAAGPETLSHPAALADELGRLASESGPVLCVGDGASRYRSLIEDVAGVAVAEGEGHPDVIDLALLGMERLGSGRQWPVAQVRAHYLRDADVRIKWEQRQMSRPEPPAG